MSNTTNIFHIKGAQWGEELKYSGASVYEQIFRAKNASCYERCLGLRTQSGNSGKLRVSAQESVAGEVWLSARRCLNVPGLLMNFIVFCSHIT
jgi:hypothetical protein